MIIPKQRHSFRHLGFILKPGMHLLMKIFVILSLLVLLLFLVINSAVDDIKREQFIAPVFEPEDNVKELTFLCKETFNRTLDDNLKVIQNYPRGIADDFLWRLGANKTEPSSIKTFPVFATAFNKPFYPRSQGLFKSLHERFLKNPKYGKDVQIIVYDLGMTARQLKMVTKHCRCEVRRFQFENFPPHVKTLHTYAFKPIIVQQLLMEFGFVWWMDSSVRFTTDDIDSAITYAKQNSILYRTSILFNLTKQTDKRTFKFLGEGRCKFRPFGEMSGGNVMFHYDR